MIFEFFKKIFGYSTDEGNRKRKSNDLKTSEEDNISKKYCSGSNLQLLTEMNKINNDSSYKYLDTNKKNNDELQNSISSNPGQINKKIQEGFSSSKMKNFKSNKFTSNVNSNIHKTKKPLQEQVKVFETGSPRRSPRIRNLSDENDSKKLPSVQYESVEVLKTITMQDKSVRKSIMKDDLMYSIKNKYNTRFQQRQKEAEELEKMTKASSKQNKSIRNLRFDNKLNYSMEECEKLLVGMKLDVKPNFSKLDSYMLEKVKLALSPGQNNEILIEDFGLSITRRDMKTLAGLNWLNDEVINFYMNLIIKRSNAANFPNVYAMNTFFYPKLLSGGHSSLKRWTKKIDIFSKDIIVVPVHLGNHWCLSIIDFRNKSIQYFDSMGSSNHKCLQALKQYILDESLDKKNQKFDLSNWKFECKKNIPQQHNGSDCGVFSCVFAEHVCANKDFNFSQKDMPHFRKKMVYEILTVELL